jgi:hypothetical protein
VLYRFRNLLYGALHGVLGEIVVPHMKTAAAGAVAAFRSGRSLSLSKKWTRSR